MTFPLGILHPPPTTSPLRILHLEDNPADAELIHAALENDGIVADVTRVETQADFLAALAEGFDVILADHTLPGFDGLSALKLAAQVCPHVPFIFVSGTLGEEVAIEAMKFGAIDYVLKERLSRIGPSVQRALREAREREERQRAETVLAGEKRLLEQIARGGSLPVILDGLCRLVEELSPGSLASILLVDADGRRLRHGAAPSLPRSYVEAIDGMRIGPMAGSCGTAVHRNEPVIVADIANDPLWAAQRALALPHGLRACWSTPVRASDGRVLASVAVYARQPRRPTASQQKIIERVTDLASIAIERKRAEEERQAHLWFLESMDRVNRAIQSTNDLERMMSDVLEAVLHIFGCDRAWLVYPCDPDATSWRVPMEHTRAEFPGAFALGHEMPVDPETAAVFERVRASTAPVRFGPGSDHALPSEPARRFGIRSMIAMAIRPKGDLSYMLGLHQCSSSRVWTPPEERLFQEIGRRLEDALTGVLILRDLRESERRLEEAQRIAHVGYWERDLVTDRYTLSEETLRIFGLPLQHRSLDANEIQELLLPADRERQVTGVAQALPGGGRYELEYRLRRPGGEVRFIHGWGDNLCDESGQPIRMFGTLQDITERKLAEQRVLAQHAVTQILAAVTSLEEATPRVLQALCESLLWDVGALWRIDREAGVLRCVELWHSNAVDVPEFEAASRERTLPRGIGLPGRVWANGEPVYMPDVVNEPGFVRASIAARELLHAGFGVPIILGHDVLGVMEFFSRDIRQRDPGVLEMMAMIGSQIGQFIERKSAEDALAHARAELAHVARVATLGEMSASIAHEISQPLAAVSNNASACLNWLDAGNLEEARQSAELVVEEGHRAGEIIGRIRALAKKDPPRKDAVEVNTIIVEVIALLRHEMRGHGVSVRTGLGEDLPPVLADRIQLQQVLVNLMMNAIEAMSANGQAPRELSIASMPSDADAVLISVADSGPGLSPSIRDRLFKAFQTTKPQGMGMGLAISLSIVESHGGRLWATANDPRGAVFHLTLPIGVEPDAGRGR
ncbi:MAG TPA: GAF domain-containing protein [Candidatus Eisenbacteria bacterium]|nr:GAF domain-containing protein [Candidatus Eisenbacteria bacterium]